jgi:hypothetical protein
MTRYQQTVSRFTSAPDLQKPELGDSVRQRSGFNQGPTSING